MTRDLQSVVKEDVVVSGIRQQLRHPGVEKKTWVVVEGIDDQKLFSKLINGPHVKFEFAPTGFGKIRLLKVVAELLKETNQVIGIRDADFLHLEPPTDISENIFLTDYHDAEMMMIACDNAYQQVAAEYLVGQPDPFSLREKILQSIAFVGGLKWLNTNGLDINPESVELTFISASNFYNSQTCQFDEEGYLQNITNKSTGKKRVVLATEVRDKIKNISYFYNLCNGKDFQEIFYCHSTKKKGGLKGLGESFVKAYRHEDFQQTRLYQHLSAWSHRQAKLLFKPS